MLDHVGPCWTRPRLVTKSEWLHHSKSFRRKWSLCQRSWLQRPCCSDGSKFQVSLGPQISHPILGVPNSDSYPNNPQYMYVYIAVHIYIYTYYCMYVYIYMCIYLFIYNTSTYIKGFRSICGLVGASNRRSSGMIKSNVREDMAEIGCSYIPMATYPVAKLKKMKVRSHKIHPSFIYIYRYIHMYA